MGNLALVVALVLSSAITLVLSSRLVLVLQSLILAISIPVPLVVLICFIFGSSLGVYLEGLVIRIV